MTTSNIIFLEVDKCNFFPHSSCCCKGHFTNPSLWIMSPVFKYLPQFLAINRVFVFTFKVCLGLFPVIALILHSALNFRVPQQLRKKTPTKNKKKPTQNQTPAPISYMLNFQRIISYSLHTISQFCPKNKNSFTEISLFSLKYATTENPLDKKVLVCWHLKILH